MKGWSGRTLTPDPFVGYERPSYPRRGDPAKEVGRGF
jgi:hypothetical protein